MITSALDIFMSYRALLILNLMRCQLQSLLSARRKRPLPESVPWFGPAAGTASVWLNGNTLSGFPAAGLLLGSLLEEEKNRSLSLKRRNTSHYC